MELQDYILELDGFSVKDASGENEAMRITQKKRSIRMSIEVSETGPRAQFEAIYSVNTE